MGRAGCTESQCLNSIAIPLLPSVPVQYSYTSTPLSACTVQLYLYSPQCLYSIAIPLLPLGPYGLYRASVPVQYSYTSTPPIGRTACTEPKCLYSTAIPLLPLWAVRPVQSLSACTLPFLHITLHNYIINNIIKNHSQWKLPVILQMQPHNHLINHTPMYLNWL